MALILLQLLAHVLIRFLPKRFQVVQCLRGLLLSLRDVHILLLKLFFRPIPLLQMLRIPARRPYFLPHLVPPTLHLLVKPKALQRLHGQHARSDVLVLLIGVAWKAVVFLAFTEDAVKNGLSELPNLLRDLLRRLLTGETLEHLLAVLLERFGYG